MSQTRTRSLSPPNTDPFISLLLLCRCPDLYLCHFDLPRPHLPLLTTISPIIGRPSLFLPTRRIPHPTMVFSPRRPQLWLWHPHFPTTSRTNPPFTLALARWFRCLSRCRSRTMTKSGGLYRTLLSGLLIGDPHEARQRDLYVFRRLYKPEIRSSARRTWRPVCDPHLARVRCSYDLDLHPHQYPVFDSDSLMLLVCNSLFMLIPWYFQHGNMPSNRSTCISSRPDNDPVVAARMSRL